MFALNFNAARGTFYLFYCHWMALNRTASTRFHFTTLQDVAFDKVFHCCCNVITSDSMQAIVIRKFYAVIGKQKNATNMCLQELVGSKNTST